MSHQHDQDDDDNMDEQSSSQTILAAGVFIGVIAIRAIRRRRVRHLKTLIDDDIRSIEMSDMTASDVGTPLLKSPRIGLEESVLDSPFGNVSIFSEDIISESDTVVEEKNDVNVLEKVACRVYKRRIVHLERKTEKEQQTVQRKLVDELPKHRILERKVQAEEKVISGFSLLEKGFTQTRSEGLVEVCVL